MERTFRRNLGVKYDRAVECLIKDREALLVFYDFRAALLSPLRRTPLNILLGRWTLNHSPAFIAMDLLARLFSPYDIGPRVQRTGVPRFAKLALTSRRMAWWPKSQLNQRRILINWPEPHRGSLGRGPFG